MTANPQIPKVPAKTMGRAEVCILLSTYNGAEYLACQIESIQAQTFKQWLLLIRDDGSVDTTTTLIDKYCHADPRIKHIESVNSVNTGPRASFARLLVHALETKAQLIMFSDQDDYWEPTKTQQFYDKFAAENGPCLIYSNIELTDSELQPVETAYSFQRGLNEGGNTKLNSLLSLNHIPGCCMAINRKLAELASPIPETALMHDWWLALTAAACGKLIFIDEKLIKYRQHTGNTIGVTSIGRLLINYKQWASSWTKGSNELCQTINQAKELTTRLKLRNIQSPELLGYLEKYANLAEISPYKRIKTAHQLGLRKGVLRWVLYVHLVFLHCGGGAEPEP